MQLFVDSTLVIDSNGLHSYRELLGSSVLTAGSVHNLRLLYLAGEASPSLELKIISGGSLISLFTTRYWDTRWHGLSRVVTDAQGQYSFPSVPPLTVLRVVREGWEFFPNEAPVLANQNRYDFQGRVIETPPVLLVTKTPQGIRLSWQVRLQEYRLESTRELNSGTGAVDWQSVPGSPSTEGENHWIDIPRNDDRAFYRLSVRP